MILDRVRRLGAAATAHLVLRLPGGTALPPDGDWSVLDQTGKPWSTDGPIYVDGVRVATEEYADAASGGIDISSSGSAANHPGTGTDTALVTVTLPGGTLGINGRLLVSGLVTVTPSVNVKRVRLRMNGIVVASYTITNATTAGLRFQFIICNRGAEDEQVGMGGNSNWGETTVGAQTFNIDTSVDIPVSISVVLAAAEAAALEQHAIMAIHKA